MFLHDSNLVQMYYDSIYPASCVLNSQSTCK